MRISFTDEIEGGRILYPIGRVQAASGWHANGMAPGDKDWKEAALRELIRTAEDIEADAIVGIDYAVDGVSDTDLATRRLERVTASGGAVKLARG
jgi:uncharacterized protein YbjQ (UPF0145 family)